jgi:hypothetical protein
MTQTETYKIVSTPCPTAGTTQLHHRDFPEIRAEGNTSRAAATQLLNQLTRALDSALTNWRRDCIQNALTDVRAFLETTD